MNFSTVSLNLAIELIKNTENVLLNKFSRSSSISLMRESESVLESNNSDINVKIALLPHFSFISRNFPMPSLMSSFSSSLISLIKLLI